MLGYFTVGLLANGGFHTSEGCGKSTGEWRVLFGLIDYHCWLWTVTRPLTAAGRSPRNQVPHPPFLSGLESCPFFPDQFGSFWCIWVVQKYFERISSFLLLYFFFLTTVVRVAFLIFFLSNRNLKREAIDTTIWRAPTNKKKFVWDFYFRISHKWLSQSICLKLYF